MGKPKTRVAKDFVILGPTLSAGSGNILAAVHSLYFLPENYKLVFTGAERADRMLYNSIMVLVERDELGSRVEFVSTPVQADAVILPHLHQSRARNTITGDTPEALASAILNVARTTA